MVVTAVASDVPPTRFSSLAASSGTESEDAEAVGVF